MKNKFCMLIFIIILCFIPCIPYDKQVEGFQTGVVVVQHKSVVSWATDQYNLLHSQEFVGNYRK